MAVLYWGFNKKLGTFLLMGWSANRLLNGFLKITVCAYRPWIRNGGHGHGVFHPDVLRRVRLPAGVQPLREAGKG